ncbi:terpene synthase family protein [Hyalangium versicolor]|uniref:terpene synthase family protein n=1 Tax=Hyalangium versicolor TaxID=2861190 RepID=UPI001CCD47D3|nr:terpene synthase family protein [Hyalangium versicolor]
MQSLSPSPAVEFDLGTVSRARLQGRLNLVDVAGHGWPRPVATPEEIAQAEQECIAWAVKTGLVRKGEPYFHKFCQSRLAALAACTLPDVLLRRSVWFIQLQAFIFTLDDALDNLIDVRAESHYLSYGQLQEVFGLFMRCLMGERPRVEGHAADFPLIEPFLEVLLEVRQRALESGMELSWFIASMAQYFEALAWEHGAHTDAGYSPSLSTYMHNREQTISYVQSIESFLIIQGVSLSPMRRQLHPVKLLLTNACRHVILINDVFSLAKEIACGELDNVFLLDQGNERSSLSQRFHTLLDQLNSLAADITHITLKLEESFPEDGDLLAYATTIIDSVNGHIAWYAKSRRYGRFVRPPTLMGLEAKVIGQ